MGRRRDPHLISPQSCPTDGVHLSSPSDYASAVLVSEGEGPVHGYQSIGDSLEPASNRDDVLRDILERWVEEYGEAHDDRNQARYNQILKDANIAVDFLKLCESPVLPLIRGGESKDVEFKSSFRWSFHGGKNNPKLIKTAALKEIVAFLNSGGGTLLLGVRDDGSIAGIHHDDYKNHDEYHRAVLSTIRERIGAAFLDYVGLEFGPVGEREVVTIKCQPAPPGQAAFLDDNEYYIRQGSMSVRLKGKQLADRLRGH